MNLFDENIGISFVSLASLTSAMDARSHLAHRDVHELR
jgi:hypothetical protein